MNAWASTTLSERKKPSASTAAAPAISTVHAWPPAGSDHATETLPPDWVRLVIDGGAANAVGATASASAATRATRSLRAIDGFIGARVRLLECPRQHDARKSRRRRRPLGLRPCALRAGRCGAGREGQLERPDRLDVVPPALAGSHLERRHD